MEKIIVPLGPGKGQVKSLAEALQALIGEMRSHVRDLNDMRQAEQAELLEFYLAALALIEWQVAPKFAAGTGRPRDLVQLAEKYNLALPAK